MNNIKFYKILIFLFLLLGFSGCSSTSTSTPSGEKIPPCATCPPITPVPTTSATQTSEPTTISEPRTLRICLGAEPDTLFFYESSMLVTNSVWEAIYDGPIDPLSYRFKPVILEKLPNLADGDARINPVTVHPGDQVVSNDGKVVQLSSGELVRPYGCNRSDCAVVFDGESLEMDQLSADFTLMEDIFWEDGEPLTAADAVFSYEIAQQCETSLEWCTNTSVVERTADFITLDAHTTRWIGLPGFLDQQYMKNFFHPLPKHQLQGMTVQELAEADLTARTPMGWGPYRIEKWEIGKEIRMSKNPFYFQAEQDLPRFDNLVFTFTGENPIYNISKILAGECDIVEQDAGLEVVMNLLIGMHQLDLLQAHMVNGIAWEHLDFSLLHADHDDGFQAESDRPDLFGDVRTRRAIAMCLDREKLINDAVFNLSDYERHNVDTRHAYYVDIDTGDMPYSFVPADHPLYNPNIADYEYSPEKAKALLEEVGWTDHDGDPGTPRQARSVPNVLDGTLLEFNYWTTDSDGRKRIGQIVVESLTECGIKADAHRWKPAEFYAVEEGPVFSRNFDVVEFTWLTGEIPPCELFLSDNIPGDPQLRNPDGTQRFPRGWEGLNNTGYSSLEFDQACEAALAALPGQPGFIENHMLAQEVFARDLPVIPLFQRLNMTAARIDMCGYWMDATADSDTWNIEQYGYGDECDN